MSKPRLRFKRQSNEQGLARVCQGLRSHELWYGDERVGGAYPLHGNWPLQEITGYYWSCPTLPDLGIEYRSTADHPVATMEGAKAALRTYVEECLKKAGS